MLTCYKQDQSFLETVATLLGRCQTLSQRSGTTWPIAQKALVSGDLFILVGEYWGRAHRISSSPLLSSRFVVNTRCKRVSLAAPPKHQLKQSCQTHLLETRLPSLEPVQSSQAQSPVYLKRGSEDSPYFIVADLPVEDVCPWACPI